MLVNVSMLFSLCWRKKQDARSRRSRRECVGDELFAWWRWTTDQQHTHGVVSPAPPKVKTGLGDFVVGVAVVSYPVGGSCPAAFGGDRIADVVEGTLSHAGAPFR
jgi:hypothetical protein